MPTIVAVGYWYKGDYQIPLLLMEELRGEGVEVLDLSLGAIKASTFLSELSPSKLIILASEKRGRKELRVYKINRQEESPYEAWAEVYNNMRAYFMDVDSLIKTAIALNSLPDDTTVIEFEVENTDGELSQWGKECMELMKKEVLKLLK